MPTDLRQHLRFLIQCAIGLKVNNHSEVGTLINLSLSGCGAKSSRPFQVGEHLAVVVQLPDDQPPMEIDLATVRWSAGERFGLEFLNLRSEERGRLREFIESLDTGLTH